MRERSEGARETVAVTSLGLWRRRDDLASLFPNGTIRPSIGRADRYVGWGWRASGLRAKRLAAARSGHLTVLEDGFLSGFSPKLREPAFSYILDGIAPHYDANSASDLERRIEGDALSEVVLNRARSAIATLVRTGLSKWNDAPARSPASLGITRRYLLLIDQVAGDLSLRYGAPPDAFERLLAAARAEADGRTIVVRAHPVARGPLGALCCDAADITILAEPCRLAPLLAEADAVFTVSSHAGFEALMHGTPVKCFGSPFYAGWGLTTDAAPIPRRTASRSLEALFAAAYIEASRYLDPHDRTLITLEEAIDQLLHLRDVRMVLDRRVITLGMSPWKRRAVEPFLIGPGGRPKHRRALPRNFAGDAVVWGADPEPVDRPNIRTVRLEDGPLRSRGLGAALRFPLSLVRAFDAALPFDARTVNVIERALQDAPLSEAELDRARSLRERLVAAGATKYMLRGNRTKPLPGVEGRLKVLVVGQVEGDASLRYGAPDIATNDDLLTAVRARFPDAFIAYRDHPDVHAGLRPGRASRRTVDLDVTDHDLNALFGWADRLETLTSGTGFEALLRGIPVGTHGWPFYAGWGLTDDRLDRPARGVASVDALLVAIMLRSAVCIHPTGRVPCSPERLLDALANAPQPASRDRVLHRVGRLAGRIKRLVRRQR